MIATVSGQVIVRDIEMGPFNNKKSLASAYNSRSMSILNINRSVARRSLGAGLAMAAMLIPAHPAFSVAGRELSLYHTHTGKTLQITYAVGGEYLPESLQRINELLGDFRTGDRTAIDPELLDVIWEVRDSLGSNGTFEIISAYRSPQTNEMLRGRSGGVAKNSQHLLGKAIDVRLRGVDSGDLRDAAIGLQRGGVGYYRESDFVHIDTGRVRRW
jgi:uncharacterized protein YcbK (DUF882 family)